MDPAAVVYLVTLFIQALLYGLYLVTLGHCLRWIFFSDDGWKWRIKVTWLMPTVAIVIFLLSTVNLGVLLPFQIKYYLLGGMKDYVAINLLLNLAEFITMAIVDVTLVYRCWLVYMKSWRVICLPVLFWFGSLTSTALTLYYNLLANLAFAHGDKMKYMMEATQSLRAINRLLSCHIATNIYATSAIIYRILRVARASGHRARRLHNIVNIIAESGILYTSLTVLNLVGSIVEPHNHSGSALYLELLADTMNFSLAGITFNVVLIRIYKGRTDSTDSYVDSGRERTSTAWRFAGNQMATPSEPVLSTITHDLTIQECHRSLSRNGAQRPAFV